MSKKTDNVYEPPKIELLEIMTEQAVLQASTEVLDWGNGGGLAGGEAEETSLDW